MDVGRGTGHDSTRGSVELFRAAFDAAPSALLVVNGAGRLVIANARLERLFGYARSALDGMALEALLASTGNRELTNFLATFLAAPEMVRPVRRVNLTGLRKQGDAFPVEMEFTRMATESGPMAVVVVEDVTERRGTELRHAAAANEAREGRARLEALLDFAPAFIIAVSRGGTIDFINRTLPHYKKEDVIGGSWLTYFPPERQVVMEQALEAVFDTGETQNFEVVTPGPNGASLWFSSQMGAIRDGGQIVGAVLVSQDVTERKVAQTQLLEARHMALLGTLAAGVAHEINTPIQFVGDSLQFLRDSATDLLGLIDELQSLRRAALEGMPIETARAAATRAEDEADLPYLRENIPLAFARCADGLSRVTTIVRSLKEFAHPPGKEMTVIDLNRAIESTLTIATNEYKYVAELETQLGELPPVNCHASEIGQVILNMLVNAAHAIGDVVKGSDRRGRITVSTAQQGDAVVITISDTGTGIPDAIQARIFDPFFTTKEVGKGTGQGLAIARSVIKDRHGGDITFETKVGHGTTFFIRLPIDCAAPSAA
jgi:PAS domain S-box-containing protein